MYISKSMFFLLVCNVWLVDLKIVTQLSTKDKPDLSCLQEAGVGMSANVCLLVSLLVWLFVCLFVWLFVCLFAGSRAGASAARPGQVWIVSTHHQAPTAGRKINQLQYSNLEFCDACKHKQIKFQLSNFIMSLLFYIVRDRSCKDWHSGWRAGARL